jgi:hypothetical protein
MALIITKFENLKEGFFQNSAPHLKQDGRHGSHLDFGFWTII